MKKILLILFFFCLIFTSAKLGMAVENCCGLNSPGNDFSCGPHAAGYGNCTWYARYMRPEVEGICTSNAANWFNQAQNGGLPTGQIPAIGSIAVFNYWMTLDSVYQNAGHVAYVESINQNGSFNVSEMGWDSWNCVRTSTYDSNSLDGLIGFIFSNGALKFTDSPTVYYYSNGQYWPILNEETYNLLGFTTDQCYNSANWSYVTEVNASQRPNYNIRDEIVPSQGIAVKIVDAVGPKTCSTLESGRDPATVYLFDGTEFHAIFNEQVYFDLGYATDWSDVIDITQDLFNLYGEGYLIDSIDDAWWIAGSGGNLYEPENLTATAVLSSQINLSWDRGLNPDYDDLEYKIYRSTSNNSSSASYIDITSNTSYSDTGLSSSTTYYYWVTAIIDGEHESDFSDVASATTESSGSGGCPYEPENLTATGASPSRIDLTWDRGQNPAQCSISYVIYKNTSDNLSSASYLTSTSNTFFSSTALNSNTTYYYWVKAVLDGLEESGFSSVASATTKPSGSGSGLYEPENLTVIAISSSQIDLSWDRGQNPPEYTGLMYNVYRDGGLIASTSNTSYSDSQLDSSTEYCYQITAYLGNDASGFSSQKCATTHADQPAIPISNFTASTTSGYAPLDVQFTDTSSGEVDSWSWDFGDGDTSTLQSPIHTYSNPDTYTVSLTVSGPYGSDSETKTGYVAVIGSGIVLQPGPENGVDVWVTNVFYDYGEDNEYLRIGGWGDSYYSLISFDLAGLPSNVYSAKVYLYSYEEINNTSMYLDRVTTAWDESTRWPNRPSYTNIGTIPSPTIDSWYIIDVTDLYNGWKDGTWENHGIQLRPTDNWNKFNKFHSSDYIDDPSLRPKLIIEFAGSVYYCDNDNDGYIASSFSGTCSGNNCEPQGCQLNPGNDCDDDDNTVYLNAPEFCDNLDNNCDGQIDENLTQQTICGVGVCEGNIGIKTCTAGQWGNNTCNPFSGATQEGPPGNTSCSDGLDNNCDGNTDITDTDCNGPIASFPFIENFNSGALNDYWSTNSTGGGSIQVTMNYNPCRGGYHLTMDDNTSGSIFSLNELVLTIDLDGQSGVILSFYHREFNDENHVMPNLFTGSSYSDGVAISTDGNMWHKVQGLTSMDGINFNCKWFAVNLDAAVAEAGIGYNSTFKIKFQQYDNHPILADGFAFDNIELYQQIFSETDCFDAVDNDGDRLTDCQDPDCEGTTYGACSTGLPGICGDGTITCTGGIEECVQNNQPQQEGPPGDPTCSDGVDNDCNWLADMNDTDCYLVSCQNLPVNLLSSSMEYATIQEAYDAVEDGDTIQVQSVITIGSLNANRNISVTIEGGYDCSYNTNVGNTFLVGTLAIENGKVTIENFQVVYYE